MLRKHLSNLVEALGLEQRAPHEFDRLQWSFKDKEFKLERKAWEMERRESDRERDRLRESLEREKDRNRRAEKDKAAAEVKESSGLGEVGVLWTVDDGALDGSGLLSRLNPVEMVGQLREIALGYGHLRFVRGYSFATTSGALPSSHVGALAKLETLGVELRSCLGREGTSSVVHQVVLDAMLFATSSSNAQTTVFLITDNEEFVYLAAKLRMMGCNVIFICRSMDESKQLLRDVASAVYELDLLFPPTEPSSSSAAGGSAPPPPPSSEPQSSSITFAQDTNGGSRSLSQKEDTSVGQQEQANRTQDSSGFGTEETQPSSHVVQPDDSEATQVVSQEQDPSLVSQEYQGEEESERRGSPTFDAYGIGSGDNDDVEQQQYLVEKKYETEGDSVVYQEESSPEIETSPFDSKDVVEAETPDVAEEATKDVAGEKSQEGIEDWEIDSTARGEDKESMTTPTVAVFGFGSKDVVEQQQQPLAVEDPTDELASEGTRSGSAHWEIETPPQLPESHWEGEGWGVPPPAAFDASTVKSPSPPAPFSWPPAAAANSLTPSSTLSPSTSTSQPLPSSPESPKASTSWASVAKVPAPVAPLPTPSNPPHHFPQTHSRTPTYIHTPSPVPSTCRSSSSRSSNPNGLPLDLTPLLTVISWSLPDRRPHQSKVNDILLENEPDFYRKHGGRRWKSYSEAAAEAGLVEMGTDAKNGQWISLTKKGLAKIGRK